MWRMHTHTELVCSHTHVAHAHTHTHIHTHTELEEQFIVIAICSNHTVSLGGNYCLRSGSLGESEIEFLLQVVYGGYSQG